MYQTNKGNEASFAKSRAVEFFPFRHSCQQLCDIWRAYSSPTGRSAVTFTVLWKGCLGQAHTHSVAVGLTKELSLCLHIELRAFRVYTRVPRMIRTFFSRVVAASMSMCALPLAGRGSAPPRFISVFLSFFFAGFQTPAHPLPQPLLILGSNLHACLRLLPVHESTKCR